MDLRNKTILLISPEPWNHIFVSKHHYAVSLAQRGNIVYFLNPPSNSFSCNSTKYENLYSVNYEGFLKGLRFLPSILKRYFIRKKFQSLENLCKAKFDIIWSFDTSVFFNFSALTQYVFCISHIVDWNQDFEFDEAARTANLCLTTTKYILQKQKIHNQESYNLGHGYMEVEVNRSRFEISNVSKIKCGYAGNLDIKYIDWELLGSLIAAFPNVDFHFAGQWENIDHFPEINNSKNFYYEGVLSSMELSSFYSVMDILILIYKYQKYPKQLANPHKMMEYLASGKMIVANWTEEYRNLDDKGLITMYKREEEFTDIFKKALDNLPEWNQREKAMERIAFTSNHTYDKQIDRIENIIKKMTLCKY